MHRELLRSQTCYTIIIVTMRRAIFQVVGPISIKPGAAYAHLGTGTRRLGFIAGYRCALRRVMKGKKKRKKIA